jgi:alpha-L-fucosidase
LIGDPDRYFPVFEQQFREILGGYGELCEIWLDGALDPFGPDVRRPDGTPVGPQYWDRLIAIARHLQPNAVIMGGTQPDVRWTGNEDGLAPYPLWNVLHPGQEAAHYLPPGVTGWLVPEADIFTRPSWFWTPGSDDGLASLARLLDVYDRSIGHGANLLVNMTPDRRGRIPAAEVARLTEFGAAITRRFGQPLAQVGSEAQWKDDLTLELPLTHPAEIGTVVIEEDLRCGQRIRCYRIEAKVDGHWREVAAGTSVGRRRIQRLPGGHTDGLRLRILDGDIPLNIRAFACYAPADPVLRTDG